MDFINRPIVKFNRPFFLFNKSTKEVIVVPTIVQSGHESVTTIDLMNEDYREANSIEELMLLFDELGLVMPEENTWDFPERPLRLAIPNDDMTEIIKQVPTIVNTLEVLKDFIIVRNRTQYIYLVEIYPDDQVLFANYIQSRP